MWIIVAGVCGALAVIAGAFGAHGLASRVDADKVASFNTAALYHLLHSVALMALALFQQTTGRSITWPASLFVAGVVLFSGSIYLLVLTGQKWLGPITPLGGVCFIAGWIAVALLARG